MERLCKPVNPWLRSLIAVVAFPICLPLYALFAVWIGHLSTGTPAHARHWTWHDLFDLAALDLLFGLVIGAAEFFMPQPRSWVGHLTGRQVPWALAAMAVALVLVPVGGSLLLKLH